MRMKKKGYAKGGKLKMTTKNGKKVPFFAADGKGKMSSGGAVKKTAAKKVVKKTAAKKVVKKKMGGGSMKKKGYAKGGKVTRKLSGGDLLGTISPAYGMLKGKGAFGKIASMGGGLLGAAAAIREDAKKKEKNTKNVSGTKPTAMKHGGAMKKKGYAKGGSMKKKGYAKGGVVKKSSGGVARGGGAAKRGLRYTRSG